MSEQWYCPDCGPITKMREEFLSGGYMCAECEAPASPIPAFVTVLQQQIEEATAKIWKRTAVRLHEQLTAAQSRLSELEAKQPVLLGYACDSELQYIFANGGSSVFISVEFGGDSHYPVYHYPPNQVRVSDDNPHIDTNPQVGEI